MVISVHNIQLITQYTRDMTITTDTQKQITKKFICHKGSTRIHGELKIYTKVKYSS